MLNSVFQFEDYKLYLKHWCSEQGHGSKMKIAQAMRCQTSYVSHVLQGKAHFSLEQAEALSEELIHTKKEKTYFLTLVEYTKASTPSLRRFFKDQLEEMQKNQLSLKEKTGIRKTLTLKDQSVYYSSWHYAAVHVICSISSCSDSKNIAEALRLSHKRVSEVLKFLTQTGLVEQKNGRYEMGITLLHLERESPLLLRHHSNLRLLALENLSENRESNLHYSSFFSLDEATVKKIKELLANTVKASVEQVKVAPSEQLWAMNIDFFNLKN